MGERNVPTGNAVEEPQQPREEWQRDAGDDAVDGHDEGGRDDGGEEVRGEEEQEPALPCPEHRGRATPRSPPGPFGKRRTKKLS